MDIEKAIDILNDPEADMVYTVEEINLACLVAIDALKKQIPKKPIIKPFNELMRMKVCHHIKCPSCDYQLNLLEFKNDKERIFKDMSEWSKYCYECGQRLDWEV